MNTTAWSDSMWNHEFGCMCRWKSPKRSSAIAPSTLAAHGLAARGVGLPGAVERGVGDHETGGPVSSSRIPSIGKPCRTHDAWSAAVAFSKRSQIRRNRGGTSSAV